MFQVPAKGRAERTNVMLKIKVSESNGNKVVTGERIGMSNPIFVPSDQESFRKDVFSYSDFSQLYRLEHKKDPSADDLLKVNYLKEEAKVAKACPTVSRAVKVVTIGLGEFFAPVGVPADFADVYDVCVNYAKTYTGSEAWNKDRKTAYTNARTAFTELANGYIHEDGRIKENFDFKISSKDFELFLNKLYTYRPTTDKVEGRTVSVKSLKLENGFKEFCSAVCMACGYRKEVTGKVKIVADIF